MSLVLHFIHEYTYVWKQQQEKCFPKLYFRTHQTVVVENQFSLTLWSVHAVFIFQGETPAINWWTAVCGSNCHWGHAVAKASLTWQECGCKCIIEMQTMNLYFIVFADFFFQKQPQLLEGEVRNFTQWTLTFDSTLTAKIYSYIPYLSHTVIFQFLLPKITAKNFTESHKTYCRFWEPAQFRCFQ